MRATVKIVFIATLMTVGAVTLAACSGALVEPAGTPGGSAAITVPVTGGNLAAANDQAAKYCRGQGRTAQLLARNASSAYYNCTE